MLVKCVTDLTCPVYMSSNSPRKVNITLQEKFPGDKVFQKFSNSGKFWKFPRKLPGNAGYFSM
jgi:hypothetical protein